MSDPQPSPDTPCRYVMENKECGAPGIENAVTQKEAMLVNEYWLDIEENGPTWSDGTPYRAHTVNTTLCETHIRNVRPVIETLKKNA